MWKPHQHQASSPPAGSEGGALEDDHALVARVVAGDRDAVGLLVDRHHAPMACVAASILGDTTQVPDVVQDSWIRVLGGLAGFEFRSSLKTWILSVTANVARTAAKRLGRNDRAVWAEADLVDDGPTVDPSRFSAIGGWRDPPRPWSNSEPEAALLQKELHTLVQREIAALPPNQRVVVILRDVEELSNQEICELIGLTEANQRILLHRGRTRLRAAIERELGRE